MREKDTFSRKGFTLIELLIASAVGLFIIGALTTAYFTVSRGVLKGDSSLEDSYFTLLSRLETVSPQVKSVSVSDDTATLSFVDGGSATLSCTNDKLVYSGKVYLQVPVESCELDSWDSGVEIKVKVDGKDFTYYYKPI